VTAVDVIDRRARLASGLRVPVDQCWPEPVAGQHAGRLGLWVADEPVPRCANPGGRWPARAQWMYGAEAGQLANAGWDVSTLNSTLRPAGRSPVRRPDVGSAPTPVAAARPCPATGATCGNRLR
jgi:hypothetical protein